MSLNRHNPRRDANEPEIRKRFAFHGWHTEQLSGKGMPDLLAWPPASQWYATSPHRGPLGAGALLVDVKTPNGAVTQAQVDKWSVLRAKDIPVYIARSEADVDAIVAGTAVPWAPWEAEVRRMARDEKRGMSVPAGRVPGLGAEVMREMMKPPGEEDYDAALGRATKAAREAQETFAPPHHDVTCECRSCVTEQKAGL